MISLGVWCEKLTLRVFMLPMKVPLTDHHGRELMTVEHSKDPARIAISINQFHEAMMEMKQKPLDLMQLRRELRLSKRYPFIEQKSIYSAITQKSVQCFIFSDKEGKANALAA